MDFDAVTTGTGDRGESGLYSGERLPKDDPLFEVLGDMDELNSWLGLIKATIRGSFQNASRDVSGIPEQLEEIQRSLHRVAAEAATSHDSPLFDTLNPLGSSDLARLEGWERALLESVPRPTRFVVPGSTRLGATVDVARSVCRRLERRFVAWTRRVAAERLADSVPLRYLNRLSDYLFVAARLCDKSH